MNNLQIPGTIVLQAPGKHCSRIPRYDFGRLIFCFGGGVRFRNIYSRRSNFGTDFSVPRRTQLNRSAGRDRERCTSEQNEDDITVRTVVLYLL